jgi:Polyketide cyclase / dehydrase and lipid transport
MHVLTVDEHLVETAKARAIAEREMAVSAEQLFATLEDGPSWTKWTAGVVRQVTWTSPKPFAKGTTRSLILAGGITLDEVFWAWEPGRRMGFSVTAASIGWVSAFTEVYEIAPLPSERCKLRWVVAASFPGWLGKIEPGIMRVFQIIQNRLLKKLERVARECPTRA